MKTDYFDDSFKKKLGSHDSPFSEEEIERVTNFVLKNSSSSKDKKSSYSKINILYFLAIVGGLLAWNIMQYFHNQELMGSIQEMNKTLAFIKENTSVSKSPVYESDANQYHENVSQKEIKGKNGSSDRENYSNNSESTHSKNNRAIQKAVLSQSRNTNASKTELEENNFALNHLRNRNENVTSDNINETDSLIITNKEEITAPEKSKDSISNAGNAITNLAPEMKEPSFAVNDQDSVTHHVSTKKVRYQIGLGIDVGSNQLGYMMLGGVSYKNKWSLLAGLKYLTIRNEKDNDEDEYRHKHGKNFKSTYVSDTSSPSRISRIDFRYTLYQIPLLLNYKYDLRKKFSLLFSLGSDVDISVTKHVRYENNNIAIGETTHKHLQLSEPNIWFNNALLSIALQKQIKKFCVQLAPYYTQQIKLTNYKTQKFNYGLQFRLMYNI